jgi:hypothetical protein
MFYSIPISEKVDKPSPAGPRTNPSPRAAKSYGAWNFPTYKEARSFAWSKIFAYPENSYMTRQVANGWAVIEAPRKKPESMD